jgi:DNA replication protein DnaC
MGKKKKKKHYPSQKDLKEYVFIDNIYDQNLLSSSEFRSKLDLLIDNDLASCVHISGMADPTFSSYSFACNYMVNINPSIKNRIKTNNTDDDDIWNREDGSIEETSDVKKLRKVKNTILTEGMYTADLKNGNYVILDIQQHGSWRDYYTGKIYFLGKKRDKYKAKFEKTYSEYNKIQNHSMKAHWIDNPYGKSVKTRFKPMTNLIFRDKDRVLKYVDNFVNNIPKYYKYGITPKLSILLYGKPGTGKSTFYKSLADYLGLESIIQLPPEFFISGDGKGMRDGGNDDNRFKRNYVPSMYAIDEIDCICGNREDGKDDIKNSHILSDLLVFLDEPPTFYIKGKDGKRYPIAIVVATTNYYDRLDPAIKRFGRFDLTIEMVDFTKKEAEEMCHLYGLELSDVYNKEINDDFIISPAELQALCMENIDKSLKKEG